MSYPPSAPLSPFDDRVMRYVAEPSNGKGCRIWTKGTNDARGGYAQTRGRLALGERYRSLRVSRLIVAWKEGLDVRDQSWHARHSCDNPPCCNPEHLSSGTPRQNSQDMVERGRTGSGRHKITREQAESIRSRRKAGEARSSLAAEFNLHPEHVTAICSGRFW